MSYTLPDIQDQNFIFAQIIAYHSEQVAQTVKPTLHYAYFVLCLVRKRKGICTGNTSYFNFHSYDNLSIVFK